MTDKLGMQYVSFKLSRVIPEKDLPGDLYLFVGGHFIKYKSKDDFITKEKHEHFLAQKIQYIFINSDDLKAYEDWADSALLKSTQVQIQVVGEENRDVVEMNNQIKEAYFDFVTTDVTDDSIRQLLAKSRDFINLVKAKKSADRFLARIVSYDHTLADHSTAVANLSVFLAMHTGHNQQLMLENIYNGALLHDFGKTRVQSKFLEDPHSDKAILAMKKHPELGKTAMLMDSHFPDEVLRIIAEHHESFDGNGYPKGLKGPKIYELAKIVAIANQFDHEVRNSADESSDLKTKQQNALKKLELKSGTSFDPKILSKCLRALSSVI